MTRAWRDLQRSVRQRPLLADGLLAVALLAVWQLLELAMPNYGPAATDATALGLGVLGAGAVAVRRRWIWPAATVLSITTTIGALLGLNSEGLAILVLTYTAAAYLNTRQSAVATLLIWVPGMVAATVAGTYSATPLKLPFVTFFLFNAMSAMVAYLTGRMVLTRRRYVTALEERARAAEENQRALAAQAVADERRRIARELHDMVAHHVSVMGVLAAGTRRSLRRDPDTADEALATIEETGRTALREMRRLLDVMRTEPEPADPLAPQPDLAGLAALIEQVREAGLVVTLTMPSQLPGRVDPAIALTVYRIVQEALTNVLKHGGAHATAEVRLGIDADWLTVEIFDTGRGPALAGARLDSARLDSARLDGSSLDGSRVDGSRVDGVGHGLLGMRERVALYGGALRTGPRPGGGFRVYATIPLEEAISAHD